MKLTKNRTCIFGTMGFGLVFSESTTRSDLWIRKPGTTGPRRRRMVCIPVLLVEEKTRKLPWFILMISMKYICFMGIPVYLIFGHSHHFHVSYHVKPDYKPPDRSVKSAVAPASGSAPTFLGTSCT